MRYPQYSILYNAKQKTQKLTKTNHTPTQSPTVCSWLRQFNGFTRDQLVDKQILVQSWTNIQTYARVCFKDKQKKTRKRRNRSNSSLYPSLFAALASLPIKVLLILLDSSLAMVTFRKYGHNYVGFFYGFIISYHGFVNGVGRFVREDACGEAGHHLAHSKLMTHPQHWKIT